MNYGSRSTTSDQHTYFILYFLFFGGGSGGVPSFHLNGTFHLKYCPAVRITEGGDRENCEMKINQSNQTGGRYSPGFEQLMFAHLGGTSRRQLQH